VRAPWVLAPCLTPSLRAAQDIIRTAKANGVDAIHPGYGFLSENSEFARRCAEEGIQFVGPTAQTLRDMGDKTRARALAQECGLPVCPGTDEAVSDILTVQQFVDKIGYPVILKAAMGGGGRGMRVVRGPGELVESFNRASSEAKSAFGDGRMFVERYVEGPRHIEVQILADHHGNVVHLGERDCSVQRRHQKVVEMAPAVNLDPEIRNRLHADAVRLAKHVGYRNAGTVEFMVAQDGRHYFLEVNPRIQVEHTVTEEVTGVDLVQAQLLVASGATLAEVGLPSQEAVQVRGYAIQCRVTSEDPAQNFQPDFGRIESYRSPGGYGIRLDGCTTAGSHVSPHYDSLLVKVIASGSTYRQTVQKMYRALIEFRVRGVKTNLPFLQNVLSHPTFLSGQANTSFIEKHQEELFTFGGPGGGDGGGGMASSNRVLSYFADVAVNGANHPGATGPRCVRDDPALLVAPPGAPPSGWRDVLLREGPAGFAKAVRGHGGLLLMDTTWRDAHQSLLATRMRTHDLLAAAPLTAHAFARAYSLEMWGGATFDVALRFLHECPWRRLELLREKVPNIPFQMLLRGANAVGYTTYPDNVTREFVKQAKTAGVDIFRVFDSLNYLDNMLFGIDAVRAVGGVCEAAIGYTGDVSDPRKTKYTLDYYLNLTRQLVDAGIDVLAIKDMAGLLKPRAADMLVSALREEFPDLPIHIHTHDTAGTGVASMLVAAAAGADVVDVAMDAMSGLTSQPSVGAIIAATQGGRFDTGLDPASVLAVNSYWDAARGLYNPFESGVKCGGADVYIHEMPGGQYTNLKFQSQSLGLGSSWTQIKEAYAAANRLLGDIVKVTPSSKVAGDLAQFMVQNQLNETQVLAQAETLSFPESVVEYFQGLIGQPVGGFPEPLRTAVLKGKPRVEGRPGASLPPVDLALLKGKLKEKHKQFTISDRDVLSAALYPKVFDEFMATRKKFGDLSIVPTRAFIEGLEIDKELRIEVDVGKQLYVTLKAVGELLPNGNREVFFDLNGIPRVVAVADRKSKEAAEKKNLGMSAARERANPDVLGEVGAPMSGAVVEVKVKPGEHVKAGQPLTVISAMKMETVVAAPVAGLVRHVAVVQGDSLAAGDLLVVIELPKIAPLAA